MLGWSSTIFQRHGFFVCQVSIPASFGRLSICLSWNLSIAKGQHLCQIWRTASGAVFLIFRYTLSGQKFGSLFPEHCWSWQRIYWAILMLLNYLSFIKNIKCFYIHNSIICWWILVDVELGPLFCQQRYVSDTDNSSS